jgi:hypothetical protein
MIFRSSSRSILRRKKAFESARIRAFVGTGFWNFLKTSYGFGKGDFLKNAIPPLEGVDPKL